MTAPVGTRLAGYVVGTWDIDPVHSDVSFSVRHMMVSKVRGRLGTFTGQIETAPEFTDSTVTATVDAASIDTGNAQRDGHIRTADFFAVDTHPTWSFRSTGIREDDGDLALDGDLTIKGVTRPVSFALEANGFGPDAYGGTRAGFSATTTINRSDYGVDIALPLDGGGVVVGEKVQVSLEIEAVLRQS